MTLVMLALLCPAVAAEARERVFYYHNDHLGTPQVMTDQAGTVVWAAEYEPFGKAMVNEDPDGDGERAINNLRFPGQYFDAERGLHYNWHRDYDPGTGRYLQPDPIELQGGLNLYVYAENNPLRLIDELGQSAADVQKIFTTFRFSVDLMTQKGLRHRNGYWGNSQRFLYDSSVGLPGHYYYMCHEQTEYVIMFLESKSYEDEWRFERQYRTFPPHVWGKAISSNPCDPDVKFDPWKDEIVTMAK